MEEKEMHVFDYLASHEVPTVIEPTCSAIKEFGTGYGTELTFLSDESIQALRKGKLLAFSDGEYSHFLIYGTPPKDEEDEDVKAEFDILAEKHV